MPEAAAVQVTRHVRSYLGRAERVGLARDELRRFLAARGCPGGVVDDMVLIVSELVTNSVVHSKSGQGDEAVTVTTEIHPGDYLFVKVEDAGGRWRKHSRDDRPHGFDVVEALTGPGNWGVDGDDFGRVAWARLDLPSRGGQ